MEAVVFIVGDITAKIGDPSGRTADRLPLTDDDISVQTLDQLHVAFSKPAAEKIVADSDFQR
jgi:tyrosyl-tRNA synthetase